MAKLNHNMQVILMRTKGVRDLEAVAGGPAVVALGRLADPSVLVADVEKRRRGSWPLRPQRTL